MPRRKGRLTPRKPSKTPDCSPDEPDDLWHEIEGILRERQRNGRTEYLVDWKPSASTGKAYAPSWQYEVTRDALDEWKASKDKAKADSSVERTSSQAVPESQESQPPRPANWRTLERSAAAQSSKRRASTPPNHGRNLNKRQRLVRTLSPEGPAPSFTTASSAVSSSVSPQQTQEPHSFLDGKQVAVVLEKASGFDASEYLSVSGSNTQSTGISSQSLSQLESQDARIFLTQTPINSRQTVQDSQDLLVSSASLTAPSTGRSLPPSHSSPREIADSQGESQAFTALARDRSRSPSENQSSRTLAAPASQIPSHQARSHSQVSSVQRLLRSTESEQPSSRPATYQSQPPFASLLDSLPTSSQLVVETPSQPSGASRLADPLLAPRQSREKPTHQSSINSQLSQAAQLVDHDSSDPNLEQSTKVRSLTFPGATAHFPVGASFKPQPEQPRTEIGPNRIDRPSATMESVDSIHDSGSRSSVERQLKEAFDLSAAEPTPDKQPTDDEIAGIFTLPQLSAAQSGQVADADEGSSLENAQFTIQSQPRIIEDEAPRFDDRFPPTAGSIAEDVSAAFSLNGGDPAALRESLPADSMLPGTISPADILRSAEDVSGTVLPSMGDEHLGSPADFTSSRQPPAMGQLEVHEGLTPEATSAAPEDQEQLITLPFQASARDEYEQQLMSYRKEVTMYSSHFSEDETAAPDEKLVREIDQLLGKLQNICDYPFGVIGTSIEGLDAIGKTKYIRDGNGKFSFLFELLQGISVDTRILVVARSIELLRLIYQVTQGLEIECASEALELSESKFKSSAAVVRLALPAEKVKPSDFDVIIGFDSSLTFSSALAEDETDDLKRPLILRLVTTHSIDHIDHNVPRDLDALERRQAILFAIVAARRSLQDPEPGYKEPHAIAKSFYDYLNKEADDLDWDPVPIPDALLMSYIGSQGQPEIVTRHEELDKGLKRRRDDDDDEEAKRLKTAAEFDVGRENPNPPIQDEVQQMLAAVDWDDETLAAQPTIVSIHLVLLERLAEQFFELQRQRSSGELDETAKALIESQAKQLQSHERSTKKLFAQYRTALEDRRLFENKMQAAEQKLRDSEKKVEKDTEKLQQRIAALEADKARLLGTDRSDQAEETPLAANERLLKEAQEKVRVLEKRLVNAQGESEYIRDQYRAAQSAAGEAGQLRTQLKKAEEEAAKTKIRIHEINVANSVRGYLSRISELETQVKERNAELDRTRDELKASKNGRRETRQTSVPRSPRMGMLSPRAPGRSNPSSTSRGGSPPQAAIDLGNMAGGTLLPGMQLLPQQPPNGRWSEL